MSSASNHKTQGSLLLLHDRLAGRAAGSTRLVLALDAAELLGVGQDEVHVAVVGEHLADELARVLQRHAHPVVDLRGFVSVSEAGDAVESRGRVRT